MSKCATLVIVAASVMVLGGRSHAARPHALEISGAYGIDNPTGSLALVADPGQRWSFGAGFYVSRRMMLGLETGKSSCPATEVLTNNLRSEAGDWSAEARWQNSQIVGYSKILLFESSVTPYVKAGVGSFTYKLVATSDMYGSAEVDFTRVGVLASGGIQFRFGETAGAFLECSRSSLRDDLLGDVSVVNINVGILAFLGGR